MLQFISPPVEVGVFLQVLIKSFIKANGIVVTGTKGAKVIEQLKPLKNEYIIIKKRWSVFYQTDLDIILKHHNIKDIYITGIQTPNCIRTTIFDGASLNYNMILIEDASNASSKSIHQSNILDIQNLGCQTLLTNNLINSI